MAKLVDHNTATPQTTVSDISYTDEQASPAESKYKANTAFQTRKTRISTGPSPAKQLKDKINKLTFRK